MCQPTTASTSPAAESAPTSSATLRRRARSVDHRQPQLAAEHAVGGVDLGHGELRAELARGSEDPAEPCSGMTSATLMTRRPSTPALLSHTWPERSARSPTAVDGRGAGPRAERRRAPRDAPARAGPRAPRLHASSAGARSLCSRAARATACPSWPSSRSSRRPASPGWSTGWSPTTSCTARPTRATGGGCSCTSPQRGQALQRRARRSASPAERDAIFGDVDERDWPAARLAADSSLRLR